MRIIAVGCEYTGVTTLLEGLMAWGRERGINHHLDDHFSIPDRQFLSPEDKAAMVGLPPTLKERFQRFQIAYHVLLMHWHEHILLGGFHLEEAVYGPLYYYPGKPAHWTRKFEADMPQDAILVHLTAKPEVIEARMETAPHEYQIIQKSDVPMLLDRFQQEFRESWIRRKLQMDTSDLRPEQLLQTFLERSRPHLESRDLLTRIAEKLDD